MKNWNQVKLVPEFNEQGVACYKLAGGNYVNEYYVVSEADTRKLLNTPEIVGYEVYDCLIPSTSQMLYYFKEQKKVTTANILSILRGALNYPLEESCYREHIRVHDISFLSSERVFADEEIAGEIGIAAAELNEWQSQLKVTNVVSLNEFVEQGGEPVMDARGNSHFAQPEDNIEEEELKKVLSETMDLLTEKERKVILLYYYEELTLKEISNILEVSESRVSQLHTKALLKMRKKMGSYMGILTE